MNDLLESIQNSINAGFFYSAFMSSLSLPDICGYIDHHSDSVRTRYVSWFEAYMPSYAGSMSGEDAYALRCVVLHNGEVGMTQYTSRSSNSNVVLDKFQLFENGMHLLRATNNTVDGISMPNLVRISVKKYCEDLLSAVRSWELVTGGILGEHGEAFLIDKGGDSFSI